MDGLGGVSGDAWLGGVVVEGTLFFNGHGDLGDGVGHYVERVLM